MAGRQKYLVKTFQPDYDGLKRNILRMSIPRRVYNIELFLDNEIQKAAAEYFGLPGYIDSNDIDRKMQSRLAIHRFLGYDIIRAYPGKYEWKKKEAEAADTTTGSGNRGTRSWQDEGVGVISSWVDFEKYPWPDPSKIDFSEFDWCEKNLPDGMAFYALTAHILEYVTWLMGYRGLSLALFDQPDLVEAMFKKVGEILAEYTRMIVRYSKLGIVWGSDDMGFKTGCMVNPKVLIEKALPWHARCAQIAHDSGKLYLLHSCGKLDDIMEPLIDEVKIDGKHSWEDVIMPVHMAKERWGNRIAILGGIDVHFLVKSDEEGIRHRVRKTLDTCMKSGGYCLGTGNSVANYIPIENYLAMLDEGRNYM